MKNIIKIVLLALSLTFSTELFSQPSPPNGGNYAGANNSPLGGSAPITGGIGILVGLGAGYGIKKVYHIYKNKNK